MKTIGCEVFAHLADAVCARERVKMLCFLNHLQRLRALVPYWDAASVVADRMGLAWSACTSRSSLWGCVISESCLRVRCPRKVLDQISGSSQ